jgi:putative ABC transport system substrate-binding protein
MSASHPCEPPRRRLFWSSVRQGETMDKLKRRRLLISAAASLALPLVAKARQDGRVRTVGELFEWPNLPIYEPLQALVDKRFRSLGWIEGQNLALRAVHAGYSESKLARLAKQLVDERVDVIWASTTAAAVAAERATRKIPIVLAGAAAYPIECGLIESFAHPGGNVTGIAFFQGIEVQSKLAELARGILPSAKKLAWVALPPDLVTVAGGYYRPEPYYREVTQGLNFELGYYECRGADDLEPVFGAMRAWGAEIVVFEPGALSGGAAKMIAQLAMQSRIASFFSLPLNVDAGGLLSYGPIYADVLESTVTYVDRILRGAQPGDIPVEMPARLQLVINSKTAKALGINIPHSIMVQADRLV